MRGLLRRRRERRLERSGFGIGFLVELSDGDVARLHRWWSQPPRTVGVFFAFYAITLVFAVVAAQQEFLRAHASMWWLVVLAVFGLPTWAFILGAALEQKSERFVDRFVAFGRQCMLLQHFTTVRGLETRELLAVQIELWHRNATRAGALVDDEWRELQAIVGKKVITESDLRRVRAAGRSAVVAVLAGRIDVTVVGQEGAARFARQPWVDGLGEWFKKTAPAIATLATLVGTVAALLSAISG